MTKPTKSMVDTAAQNKDHLTRMHTLLDSSVFDRNSLEDGPWKAAFIELINLVDGLLLRAQQADKRVSFSEDVGVNGKIQDVTSLVTWMHSRLPELTAEQAGQLVGSHINRYFDRGTGYFANGCFFTGDFENELAFFIDDQRIYLNRHIRRAVDEAEQSFQA